MGFSRLPILGYLSYVPSEGSSYSRHRLSFDPIHLNKSWADPVLPSTWSRSIGSFIVIVSRWRQNNGNDSKSRIQIPEEQKWPKASQSSGDEWILRVLEFTLGKR